MPHKRDTPRNSKLTDLTVKHLRMFIRDEVKAKINNEVDTLSAWLGNIEQNMQILTDL